jgi:hypothetical protein
MLTHWLKKESFPCQGETCSPKTHAMMSVWKAYCPALQWLEIGQQWQAVVLELTEIAEETMRGFADRGATWILSRADTTQRHSPVVASFLEQFDGDMPAAFPIEPVLCRRWHCPAVVLDIPNPLPPRVTVGPVNLPRPASLPAPVLGTVRPEQTDAPVNPELAAQFVLGGKAAKELPLTPEEQARNREMIREQLRSFGSASRQSREKKETNAPEQHGTESAPHAKNGTA